jgi:hypothetical protein
MWTDCRWPRSLTRLIFRRRRGVAKPTKAELAEFQSKVSKKYPSLVIEA